MATVNLADQLGRKVEAVLPAAAQAMERAAQWLACRDQHQDLTAAVDEVSHALRDELSIERSTKADYSRSEAQLVLIDVGVNALMSLFSGRFQTSRNETELAPPFGRVLVGVGPEGVPTCLQVFNISMRARNGGIPESVVEKRITAQGNVLLTQEAFRELVTWLQVEVLAGRTSLPFYPQAAHN